MSTSKLSWGLVLLALTATAQGCVPRHVYDTHVSELNESIAQRDKELAELKGVKNQNDRLMVENELLKLNKDAYSQLSADIREALESLKNEGLERDKSTGVWTVGTDLLFRSGSFEITPEGDRLLKKFSSAWVGRDVKFRVVGHTDTDPIRLVKDKVKSGLNLELGLWRALHVAEGMMKHGLKERNFWIESKGSTEPIATPPTSADSKRKNRRVEIYVYSANGTPMTGSK